MAAMAARRPRFFGRPAKAIPLSVSTVWMRQGEDPDDLAGEGGAVGLGVGTRDSDAGEVGNPVDGEEHEELPLGGAQFADVDVEAADGGLGEAAAPGGVLLVAGQAGDAVADEAAVQGRASELRDRLTGAAEDVVERQQGAAAELDDDRLLGRGEGAAAGL